MEKLLRPTFSCLDILRSTLVLIGTNCFFPPENLGVNIVGFVIVRILFQLADMPKETRMGI